MNLLDDCVDPELRSWYRAPMLASKMPDGVTLDDYDATDWLMEEKLDGHRVQVAVRHGHDYVAWSRPRAGDTANERSLPGHIVRALLKLPSGLYDGELIVPGRKSWDVAATEFERQQLFVLFDILRLNEKETLEVSYETRRILLAAQLTYTTADGDPLMLVKADAPSVAFVEAIWAKGGEGAMLKRRQSYYRPGKRSRDWVKVKLLLQATLTITGFLTGLNGYCSITALVDAQGRKTSVKTRDAELQRQFASDPNAYIGRRVVIEHQGIFNDGYRHPMFDHLAEDHE